VETLPTLPSDPAKPTTNDSDGARDKVSPVVFFNIRSLSSSKFNMTFVDRWNKRVAESPVGRYFHLEFSGHRKERKGSRFFTEIRAGLAT
jgi:hypothetical protein